MVPLQLGFKATSPTQVIEFLNNSNGKCFLFPDSHMGPDLLWFFQDWETKELIFANRQGKLPETLTPANYQHALQTVNPDFFYTVKVCSKHTFLGVTWRGEVDVSTGLKIISCLSLRKVT